MGQGIDEQVFAPGAIQIEPQSSLESAQVGGMSAPKLSPDAIEFLNPIPLRQAGDPLNRGLLAGIQILAGKGNHLVGGNGIVLFPGCDLFHGGAAVAQIRQLTVHRLPKLLALALGNWLQRKFHNVPKLFLIGHLVAAHDPGKALQCPQRALQILAPKSTHLGDIRLQLLNGPADLVQRVEGWPESPVIGQNRIKGIPLFCMFVQAQGHIHQSGTNFRSRPIQHNTLHSSALRRQIHMPAFPTCRSQPGGRQ